MQTLFILNDAPYGSERSYNALRLAKAMAKRDGEAVRLFLMGDAVACAKAGQKVPDSKPNFEINPVGASQCDSSRGNVTSTRA